MMESIPFALTGYLVTAAIPGEDAGTASWRLISSPVDCHVEEEAVIPCTTALPDLAHTLLTECQPGDLLRVTGNLTLPDTADGRMRLQADTLEVLWEAPLSQPPQEDAPVGGHGDRNRAILALAEALTGFADESTPGDRPDIRINIGPVGINELNVALCHSIDVTTARTHQLADAIDAMRAMLNSRPQPIDDWPDPRTLADLTDYFDGLDLTDLTRAVLEETRPVDRVAVTRALADMVGDIPVPGIEDTDQ